MSYQGIDPDALRNLARILGGDISQHIRRTGAVASSTLDNAERSADADWIATTLTGTAMRLEEASRDLVRRAGVIEYAQTVDAWTAPIPMPVRREWRAYADAAVGGRYSANLDTDTASWLDEMASAAAGRIASAVSLAIESGDAAAVVAIARDIEDIDHHSWFPSAMARMFFDLGPSNIAQIVAELVAVPVQQFDDAAMDTYARAFAAATHSDLGWGPEEIAALFEHGAAGAAQIMRTGQLDQSFVEDVLAVTGLEPYVYRGTEPIPGIRKLLGEGSDIWHHVGPQHADPVAIVLRGLADHPDLALSTLSAPGIVERLVDAPWWLDRGAGLGYLLTTIATAHPPGHAPATRIAERALVRAGTPDRDIPEDLLPGLARLLGTHLDDIALSLAVGSLAAPDATRPGLEIPADAARRLFASIARNDAAFNELVLSYGAWIKDVIASDATHGIERVAARADEIGALSFAMTYADRDVAVSQATQTATSRLSALHVLEFIAGTGVALLPGPTETATAFTVERVLRSVKGSSSALDPGPIADHNEWKEGLLDEIEYLLAKELHGLGVLAPGVDTTAMTRLAFLYMIEDMDGPLEHIMAIVEAQARRQREAFGEEPG